MKTRNITVNEQTRNKKLNLNFVAHIVCGNKYDDQSDS